MEQDLIDQMIERWRGERPDLDPTPLEIVGRVIVLAQYLERGVNKELARHKLSLGQFDILATLRRQGPHGQLTPKQLMSSVMLSSGGMTNRLDRLEEAGWITRQADPGDRRGVVVQLTDKGRKLIDRAATTRFTEAARAVPPLSEKETRTLTNLLRRWLLHAANGQNHE